MDTKRLNSESSPLPGNATNGNSNHLEEGENVAISAHNENEPLVSTPKKSHRNIGEVNLNTDTVTNESNYNTIDRNDLERGDSTVPANGNSAQFMIHKDYRLFLHNWRWLLNIIIFCNILMLVLIFVSEFFIDFMIPTGRNETFNNLIYLFIALAGNCFNLWFDDIGLFSPWDFHIDIMLTCLPVVNLIVLSMTSYTRKRIDSLSAFVSLFLIFTFGLSLTQSYNLRNYLRRLSTPMEENKHTLMEWIQIFLRNSLKVIISVLLILMTLNSFLFVIDSHNSNTEGQFVYSDDDHVNTLHITCYGLENENSDQPIILFEHGGRDTSFTSGTWIEELYNLGKIKRYCVYDRFGYGLSDSISAPWSLKAESAALRHALIDEMGLQGPFVLVGFDYGGLVARVFVGENKELCSGLLLVEAWNEELLIKNYLRRLFPGDGDHDGNDNGENNKIDFRIPEREIMKKSGFRLWWDGIWSSIGLNLHYSWLVKHRGSRERIFGRDMQHQGKFLRTKVLESVTSSLLSYKDILETNPNLSNVKLSVVSSKEMIRKSSLWGDWQRKLTKLSTNTKEWKIIDGEHEFYRNGIGKELTQEVLLRLIST